jgi:hypothetical protein
LGLTEKLTIVLESRASFIAVLSLELAAICSERSQREGIVVNTAGDLCLPTLSAFESPKRESRKDSFVIFIAIHHLHDFLDLAFDEDVISVQVQQSVWSVDVSNENGP